ncbi:MAG: hypothetical protein A2Y93_02285 [Chloroflexi bacterium RBG_13_68_17]|jgi:putative FmdB family regulatory protein|nr:MAG: hypothetical protein A2Y93_02285 [Chloroflexi bacterium RBG_13_68_17]
MPIYEFRCDRCGTAFEELVRSSDAVSELTCPACRSPQVRKRISLVAARGSRRTSTASMPPACTTST